MPTTNAARKLRNNPTKGEHLLWQILRRRQIKGFRFRRQEIIGPYIVDFMCYEKRLIIELDGGHHMSQQSYDSERTRWLNSQGFQVLRFWNNEVLGQIEAVWEVISRKMG